MQKAGENGALRDATIHFEYHTMATFQGGWGDMMSRVQVAVEMNMEEVELFLDEPGARIVRLLTWVLASSLTTDEAMMGSWIEASRGSTSSGAQQGRFCAPLGQVELRRAFFLKKLCSAYAQLGAQQVGVRSRKTSLPENSTTDPVRMPESARMSVAVPTESHVLGCPWPCHSGKIPRRLAVGVAAAAHSAQPRGKLRGRKGWGEIRGPGW